MRHAIRVCSALSALVLSGCAGLGLPQRAADGTTELARTLQLAAEVYPAQWVLPAGTAGALVVLQPGFARRCDHLRQMARAIAARGAMVLCLQAPMSGGNVALADTLADALVRNEVAPPGGSLPPRIIVGGHSAGGRFAARLGARLHERAPQRLAAALLFDPVPTAGFEADLLDIAGQGRRPMLAFVAEAHACNAFLAARPALLAVLQSALDAGRSDAIGVFTADGATHVDVEGEDGDWIGTLACGAPQPVNVQRLRRAAAGWAASLADGLPGQWPAGDGWRALAAP